MRLLTFARLNHNPDWFKEHVQFEAQASVLRIYEALVVPGLLQTEAYARDLFTMQGLKEPEKQVAARMARQKIFRRAEPPYVWALLNESAVDQPIGGATVMREQLEKLLSLSKLANFSIRIVPRSVGSHPGLGGPFKTMRAGRDEIGYAEAYLGGRVIRDRTEISMLNTSFDRIGAQALPEFLSRDLIRKVLEGMT